MIIGLLFIINIFFIKIITCFSKNWFSTDRITFIVWNLVTSDLTKMWRIKQKRSLLYASQKSPLRRKSKSKKFTQNTGMDGFHHWREGGQFWWLQIITNEIWSIFHLPYFLWKMHKTLLIIFYLLVHVHVLKSLYLYSLLFSKIFFTQFFSLHCIITQYLFPELQIFNPMKKTP